ncbi:hypothetical protein [Brumicola nitratireducens]|uniref:Uncharacterized protein n=1 Tax=Glaciecola nitratireducens (strain JCM 12485 / KCTC 12276 / FR1064) TaxID=1085623 RepID=G4QGX8_GLANF|nr:hypothetical protein [Glaciecola nitratireducens]AEP29923.1 hypothetical protein GNIT_1813 [Glaciecola nitratireducens FR1064]
MKTKEEIETARDNVQENEPSKYPGMTYEQGVADALDWAAGHVADDEFEY